MTQQKFLSGYKVLDITQIVAGAGASAVLADMGADVLRVEPRKGDILRHVGFQRAGYSGQYGNYNRGKRSVGLDLKSRDGAEIALRLAEQADILVENYRPGVLEKLGLSEPEVRKRNSSIIYLSISGFGSSGPYASRPAYDLAIQGFSGICHAQRSGESAPPALIRVPIMDKVTAMTASQWLLGALIHRERTGEGSFLELSMIDAAASFCWGEALGREAYIGEGVTGGGGLSPPEWIAGTSDGYIVWAASSDAQVDFILGCMGMEALREDSRFSEFMSITRNLGAFAKTVSAGFAKRTTAEWLKLLGEEGIVCAPVHTAAEAINDPQLVHNGIIQTFEHSEAGSCRYCLPPTLVNRSRYEVEPASAPLGQDTDAVLESLGLAGDEISRLRASGAVF